MKKIFILAILTILLIQSVGISQSTDRFIRIVGNAVHEFKSEGVRLEIGISEIQPNEYRKISYQKFDDTYQDFISILKEIGLNETYLKNSPKTNTKYSKTFTRNYILEVKRKDQINKLAELAKMEGVKISEIRYIYEYNKSIEEQLALSAIQDAKRKAENLCKALNLKLGKIINIEDISGGCCSYLKPTKEDTTIKSYTVNVSFALKG